jgi:hydroxymethylglutaryl-CoA synthase
MKKVGIDAISFYTSPYYLDLAELARKRNVDVSKFHEGLGQLKMGVISPDEDIVTLATAAASRIVREEDLAAIDHVLFATESAFDCSKSAGTYVHKLLNLPQTCRVVELKQACYAATAALQMGIAWVRLNPTKKVLVLASDVARYGLGTTGESSQGCGAVAMLLSVNPRLVAIESGSGFYTDEVMDFWRPNYLHEALVEGKYSSMVYLRALEASWKHFQSETGRSFSDIDYFCYHTPVPRLVEKAHKFLLKINKNESVDEAEAAKSVAAFLQYARLTGNSYTASLYVGLASLLDNTTEDLAGKRLGFYSYGSGCMAEYFTGIVQPHYESVLNAAQHQDMLNMRKALSYEEYEKFYQHRLPEDGSTYQTPKHVCKNFRLSGVNKHQRQYEAPASNVVKLKKEELLSDEYHERTISTQSPGKIILTGEHAVLYGSPAIAFAVNRYAYTSISPDFSSMISFNLLNARYQDSFTLQTLKEIKNRLIAKYEMFLAGQAGIRDVFQTPFELTQFAVSNMLDHFNSKILKGLNIKTNSTIPIGCGMGSSAALILSIVLATSRALKIPLPEEKILKLALEAERLQHGRASLLDLTTSLKGGCLRFHEGQSFSRALPSMPLLVVNTGMPETTTGDCVAYVREHHEASTIWQRFAEVAQEMDAALQKGDREAMARLMRENHQLLVAIGVVPETVQQFVTALEKEGASAKVCGAGAVSGRKAGVVLVTAESDALVKPLCDQYGYEFFPVEIETQGLRVA